jgi:ribosome-binding protein aMBF1 (putative translation factor)
MTITPGQVRAARQLLGWSRVRLSARIGVSIPIVSRYEDGGGQSPALDLATVRATFELAGVEFIAEDAGGLGVRLRKGGKAI